MIDEQHSEKPHMTISIAPGTIVGSYEVGEFFFQGDLATALMVRHRHFDRVGLLLHVDIGSNTNDFIRRWLDVVANLDHPNIVRLLDCVEWEGRLCPILRFIPGEFLFKVRSGGGGQDLLTVLRFLRPLASALAYCHERGVAHRSVKTANIVVDTDGQPFLTGFITASQLRGDPLDGRRALLTPGITPPEVWEYKAKCSGEWSPAEYDLSQADVWAFGVLLHYLVTSERLTPAVRLSMGPEQRAASIEECRRRICDPQPLDLSNLRAAVPAPVFELARGCLEKDPRRRYRNAGEVHQMLDAVIDDLERKGGGSVHRRIVPGNNLLLYLEPLTADAPGRFLQVKVINHLGSGSFADVYAIQEIRTGRSQTMAVGGSEGDQIETRTLAMKVLKSDWTEDGEVRARFQREAKCLARVSSNRLVKVHGSGKLGASHFLIMDRLEGQTLQAWMKGHVPLPIGQGVSIVRQLAEGLGAMHAAGLVHRDLKPENIMFDKSCDVVIADFGLVHSIEGTRLTMSGKFLGTPAYAAPEQIMGQSPTPETDLYSLVVIFYELITGHLPHQAESIPELLHRILTEPPVPVQSHRPDLPAMAAGVIMKGLARDPDRRFGSAGDLLEALSHPLFADARLESTVRLERLPPELR